MFRNQSASIYYIELEATLEERLKRNKTELRLEMKPSKRNIEISEKVLLEDEKMYIMNSTEDYPFFFQDNYLKIENTKRSAREVAEMIKKFIEK